MLPGSGRPSFLIVLRNLFLIFRRQFYIVWGKLNAENLEIWKDLAFQPSAWLKWRMSS